MASRKVTAAVTARPAPRRESAALWVRRMSGRDPAEEHRSSTRLELLFDLTFVIAVARAAIELRDALGHGHAGHALAGYSMVFFGLWWAWVNFTWFASAYDTDDVPYRLLTLLQMAGVLVFAAGIPAAFEHFDFVVVVVGYVIMRMALVAQWLRADRGHPEGRAGTLRYAAGITGIQLCWIGWLAGHIADRYGGFTIIVLGEVIAAIATAVNDTVTGSQASPGLLTVAAAGLVLVFALWWSYFWSSSWPCCWPTTSRKAGPRTHSGRSLPLKARGGASDSPGAGCRVPSGAGRCRPADPGWRAVMGPAAWVTSCGGKCEFP
jgi:low temperature requirement protein LtrA